MAEVYLTFPFAPTGYVRDDIVDALEGLVDDVGRVAGGGADLQGPAFDIDLELFTNDSTHLESLLSRLRSYLFSLPAPVGTEVTVLVDDKEVSHYIVGEES